MDQPHAPGGSGSSAAPQGRQSTGWGPRGGRAGPDPDPALAVLPDGKSRWELGLARGKRDHDKRQDLAKRDAARDGK